MRRDEDALGFTVITPAMVWAHHHPIDYPAFGKLCAAMDAEILPELNLSVVPPSDQLLSKKANRNRSSPSFMSFENATTCQSLVSAMSGAHGMTRSFTARERPIAASVGAFVGPD